jgi:hypothetical protein
VSPEVRGILASVAFVLLCCVLVFFAELVRAPFKQRNEARVLRDSLGIEIKTLRDVDPGRVAASALRRAYVVDKDGNTISLAKLFVAGIQDLASGVDRMGLYSRALHGFNLSPPQAANLESLLAVVGVIDQQRFPYLVDNSISGKQPMEKVTITVNAVGKSALVILLAEGV